MKENAKAAKKSEKAAEEEIEEIEEALEEETLSEKEAPQEAGKAEEKEAEETPEEEAGEEQIPEAEEEIEAEKEEKKELEEEIVEERFYTIPLRRAWISPRKRRAPRAMRIIKGFVRKHMKIQTEAEEEEEPEILVVSSEVNEKIWGRGIEKPPRRIRVRAVKNKEGVVTVYLAEGD